MIKERYAQRHWQDFTADVLSVIQFCIVHLNDKKRTNETPTLYSEIAHKSRKKNRTDNMTYDQIIGYISNKLCPGKE